MTRPEPWTEQDQRDLEAGRELRDLEQDLIGAAHLAAMILIRQATRMNSCKSEYIETGVTHSGAAVGDWKITVEALVEGQHERAAV